MADFNKRIFGSDIDPKKSNEIFKEIRDNSSLIENIDTSTKHAFGRMFTKAYLRHLFNVKEILGLRIASTLNLSYYISLMKIIQEKITSGDFDKWSSSWLGEMKNKKGM